MVIFQVDVRHVRNLISLEADVEFILNIMTRNNLLNCCLFKVHIIITRFSHQVLKAKEVITSINGSRITNIRQEPVSKIIYKHFLQVLFTLLRICIELLHKITNHINNLTVFNISLPNFSDTEKFLTDAELFDNGLDTNRVEAGEVDDITSVDRVHNDSQGDWVHFSQSYENLRVLCGEQIQRSKVFKFQNIPDQ